jgi:pyridoxamine 5'-phosphate oxidase
MVKKYARIEYGKHSLLESSVFKDPFEQLNLWWQEAIASDVPLLDAVNLSTVDEDDHSNARIVLLKSFDERGLVFYTNYKSKKAIELSNNPHACIVIFWPTIERQIRVRGTVKKTSRKESAEYFKTRPRGAQIGAWVSPQSSVIKNRNFLDEEFIHLSERFNKKEVPCPRNWGGFRLSPYSFEFWQGGLNRLHDRLLYEKAKQWQLTRLAP